MQRHEFPAAAAAAIHKSTGLPVQAQHVRALALAIWDTAQAEAETAEAFQAACTAGVAALAKGLLDLRRGDHQLWQPHQGQA